MIFSIQRYLEDRFERQALVDVDQYATRVAAAFDSLRSGPSERQVLTALAKIRTAFFRRNAAVKREEFEAKLARELRARFQKKKTPEVAALAKAIPPAKRRLALGRRSIGRLLEEFRLGVERYAVETFWKSRATGVLRRRPEKIAQALLAVFAKGTIGARGLVLREVSSGVGFVDVAIAFGTTLHLVELKMLKTKLVGVSQIGAYMRTEGRTQGWLVLIDCRPAEKRPDIPARVVVSGGEVRTLMVDVNPIAPSAQ